MIQPPTDTNLYRVRPGVLVILEEGEELWPHLTMKDAVDAYAENRISLDELEKRLDYFLRRERARK